ncbi:MAG: cation diffusion facilitator family transporter [Pseudomonadota bacterium]|nr:cation diffusion facilitator family transporter [Pseudomonadota bacterium]
MKDVQKAKFVTIISAICNGSMAIIKVIVGHVGNSKSLVVDGVHSITDLFTDLFVYWGAHIGSLPPDDSHPYGHQRIETMVMLFVSLLIIVIGILFAYEGIKHIGEKQNEISIYVLVVAFFSIIVNEFLYHYTAYIGKKIHSALIMSNAYHHRSDSLSSLVVLIGAFGSYNQIYWLDSFAAIVVSCMIIKLGLALIIEGTNELVDSSIDSESRKKIIATMLAHPEIIGINYLKTRLMAKKILIDASLEIRSNISLSESTLIRNQIISELMDKNPLIKDVNIMMVDKYQIDLSSKLPMDYRRKILNHIKKEMNIDLRKYDALIKLNTDDIDVTLVNKNKENYSELKKLKNIKHTIKVNLI